MQCGEVCKWWKMMKLKWVCVLCIIKNTFIPSEFKIFSTIAEAYKQSYISRVYADKIDIYMQKFITYFQCICPGNALAFHLVRLNEWNIQRKNYMLLMSVYLSEFYRRLMFSKTPFCKCLCYFILHSFSPWKKQLVRNPPWSSTADWNVFGQSAFKSTSNVYPWFSRRPLPVACSSSRRSKFGN